MMVMLLLSLLALTIVQDPPPSVPTPSPAVTDEKEQGPLLDEPLRRLALSLRRAETPPEDRTNRFADDPAAAQLGQLLFSDVELS